MVYSGILRVLDIERMCMIDVEDVILYSLLQPFANSTGLISRKTQEGDIRNMCKSEQSFAVDRV
jgi:hypothetical protein